MSPMGRQGIAHRENSGESLLLFLRSEMTKVKEMERRTKIGEN
jgi:hypothetical protein